MRLRACPSPSSANWPAGQLSFASHAPARRRYLDAPVRLLIENDHVVAVEALAGQGGLDAGLMRGHFAAWRAPLRHFGTD